MDIFSIYLNFGKKNVFFCRKRILSCVSDTEELSAAATWYNLIKSTIRAADLLIKLFWFNLPSTQFKITQGEAYSAQWKAGSWYLKLGRYKHDYLL